MSLKSTSVVSNRIDDPLLWILHISDGNIRETNGTENKQANISYIKYKVNVILLIFCTNQIGLNTFFGHSKIVGPT